MVMRILLAGVLLVPLGCANERVSGLHKGALFKDVCVAAKAQGWGVPVMWNAWFPTSPPEPGEGEQAFAAFASPSNKTLLLMLLRKREEDDFRLIVYAYTRRDIRTVHEGLELLDDRR